MTSCFNKEKDWFCWKNVKIIRKSFDEPKEDPWFKTILIKDSVLFAKNLVCRNNNCCQIFDLTDY